MRVVIIMHALLKASGTTTASGTAKLALLGDGLPPDEKAYLPYVFQALGLPELRSTVLEHDELGPMSATILDWCPAKPSGLELVYRASRDGWAPQAFHAKCGEDNSSTVTLYRVSNTDRGTRDSVVGGFSSVPWTPGSKSGYRSSPGAFVFMLKDGTLTGSTTFKPMKWGIKEGNEGFAVWCHPNKAATFGDHDLGLNWRNLRSSTLNTLRTGKKLYDIPTGSPFLSLDDHVVTEVEVFRVRLAAATPAMPASGLEMKPETSLGLIDVPTFDATMVSAEGGREDDISAFGVAITDSLMEERMALLRQAHDELAQANTKASASTIALAAVCGPGVAAGSEDSVIELSVHGTRMTTLRSTLQACPHSALAARFDEEKWPATEKDLDERGRRVMDCSPSVFSKVLDVLRLRKRAAWAGAGPGGGDDCGARVAVKAGDHSAFEEFVGMYFPGCESFIMDLVASFSF